MSHYAKLSVQAQQKFEAELVAALKSHFGADGVEVHEQKSDLLTYYKSKSGLKANVVVRQDVQGKKAGHMLAVNDLGYERNKEGTYDLHVDEDGFNKDAQFAVMKDYTERVTSKQMAEAGYSLAERIALPNNEVELVYQTYA